MPEPHTPSKFTRVPRKALVSFGVSGLAQNTIFTFLGVHLFIYYTDTIGLAPLWISAGLFAATIWDAVSDVLMGQISDRTSWKWGRRRPYILLGAVPVGLCFTLLLLPPRTLEGPALAAYFCVMLVLLFTAATAVIVPTLSLIPEMAQAYHERTRMAMYREFFGNIGDLVGLLSPFLLLWVLGAADAEGEAGVILSRRAYGTVGVGGGLLAAVMLLFTYRGTYEDPSFRRDTHIDWRAGMRAIIANRAFGILVLATSLTAFSLAFVQTLILFILQYVVRITDPGVQISAFLVNGLGALASYPLWTWYARTRGKPAAFRLGLFVSSLTFMSVFFLGPESYVTLYCVMVFAGMANVGFWTLMYALNADIADLDELETGERREGLFAGFAALLRKCALALAGGSVGIALTLIHYQENVEQTPETILGMKLVFAVPTTLLVLLAYLVFRRFPLSAERHHEVMLQLEAARAGTGVSASAESHPGDA